MHHVAIDGSLRGSRISVLSEILMYHYYWKQPIMYTKLCCACTHNYSDNCSKNHYYQATSLSVHLEASEEVECKALLAAETI